MRIFRYRCDVRSVVFVALAIAVPALQWCGEMTHPLLYLASFPLAFIACVVNHNHQHLPVFVRPQLNRPFGVVLSLAIGFPAVAVSAMHNDNHHVFNNRPEDHVRTSLVDFRWKLLNLLFLPLVAVFHYARVKSHVLAAWRTESPFRYRQLWLERSALYPALVVLLVVRPLETAIYFVLPWLFGQWGILAINHVQHDGCDHASQYNHSRNFVGRWLNWWLFNNGYHTAHHLLPRLHWSWLPEYHAKIREQIDPSLERRSLLVALWEFYFWPARTDADEGAVT